MSVKLFVRNSGAGNGCANFLGAWKECVLSAGKKTMSIKFLLLGEGGFGGGSADFIYGRGDFLIDMLATGYGLSPYVLQV